MTFELVALHRPKHELLSLRRFLTSLCQIYGVINLMEAQIDTGQGKAQNGAIFKRTLIN